MALKNLSFTKQAPSGAKSEEIAAAEAELNVSFPQDFIEFCTRWNGGFPSSDNEFYPVPDSFIDFRNEYKSSRGVLIRVLYGISEEFPQSSLLKKDYLLRVSSDFRIVPVAS